MLRWQAELERRDEVARARRMGMPVARLRAQQQAAAVEAPASVAAARAPRNPCTVPKDPRMTSTSLPRYCLIACAGTKAAAAVPAADLYQGDLFVKSLAWARRQGFTEVAILSAKHGLVPLDQLVAPYDESLIKATMAQRRRWAEHVLASLQLRWPLGAAFGAEACEPTFLAGQRYVQPLVELILAAAPHVTSAEIRGP